MRAVSSGYGDTKELDEVAVNVIEPLVSVSEVPEPKEVAVEAGTSKRSSKAKATLASMLGAIGMGATSILGL